MSLGLSTNERDLITSPLSVAAHQPFQFYTGKNISPTCPIFSLALKTLKMIAAKYGKKKKQLYIGNKILVSELNSKNIRKKLKEQFWIQFSVCSLTLDFIR